MTKLKKEREVVPKIQPKGRRCKCGTVLSVYNSLDMCALCEAGTPIKEKRLSPIRGRKRVDVL